MRKTLLAAVITAATAFAVPAFAQLNLGGAAGATGQIGVGAQPGGALPMHAVDHVGTRAVDRTTRARQQTVRTSRRALKHRHALTRHDARANADVDANASANASAAGMNRGADAGVNKRVGLDTAATAGKAGEMGRGVGGQARSAAHSAVQSADRSAGSVGDAVKGINASGNASGSVSAGSHKDAGGH